MDFIIIPLVAAAASLLTFYSGFGLGTILTPVFAIFFPIDLAISLTAIVHLLNNLFKFGLVRKHIDFTTLLKFGLPANIAAFFGAWLLTGLSHLPPIMSYLFLGSEFQVLWVKFIVAILMIGFTVFEIVPQFKNMQFDKKYLAVGGTLSGFFGGVSGHQGALRSAFISRIGLSKEAFIATGVSIACLIDLARISVYSKNFTIENLSSNMALLLVTTLAAFAGAYFGSQFLKKITMDLIQKIISVMLFMLAIALGAGII